MANFKVGTVSHYYDKIGVCVVDLMATLSVGDKIKFVRGGEDLFEEEVQSIQIEHTKVDSADAGTKIGLKVDKEVKEGAEVFKVE